MPRRLPHGRPAHRIEPSYSVVWRNLGIAYYNVEHQVRKARTAYERAFRANPGDARLLYERDQLWKRMGEVPNKRLRALQKHLGLVSQRDDLTIELCSLLSQTGRHARALEMLDRRRFQPWEGGEGLAIAQHVRARLALGREALAQAEPAAAKRISSRPSSRRRTWPKPSTCWRIKAISITGWAWPATR